MPRYSVIIPVYNRPEEVEELLESLESQSYSDFEVLIIEDGSSKDCERVVESYQSKLNLNYFSKENSGQGFSRNFGAQHATSEWLVFFDSDCVIPKDYFSNLNQLIAENSLDGYCGPDTASPDFSILQKAISYSMTSILTTGGIRGDKNSVDKVGQLRSYNMVVRKSVFNLLGGFGKTNMGEDMEFSHRFYSHKYQAAIANNLFVYHKRRNSFKSFFKQIISFGRTRILLKKNYQIPIKLVHFLPVFFVAGFTVCFLGTLLGIELLEAGLKVYGFYAAAIFIDSTVRWKNPFVGFVSIFTSFIQLLAYGFGMIKQWIDNT